MRILHLTPTLPWPPDAGGRIAVWNQLRAEQRFAEVGVLSFTDKSTDAVSLGALHSVCQLVETVKRPRTLDGVMGGARSLLTSTAMNLAKYRWPAFSEALKSALKRWPADVVAAHHLHMGGYLSEVRDAVTILREHNIDSALMLRYAGSLRNSAMSRFAQKQAEHIRETERQLCPRVDCCLMMTPDDARLLKEIAPRAKTAVVPACVDPSDYTPVELPAPGADPLLVIGGSLSFRPTGEGVVWFVQAVWPMVRKALPRARLSIFGDCPPTLRRRLSSGPEVQVLGRVDQIRPHLMGAHAFVVPLRVASGIRVRILEALAYQIPVVTTSIGCEGLAVENERHLVMADSVEEMSEAVIRLVKEPRLRQTLQREGRRLVEKSYSLTAAENSLERLYRKTADGVLAGKTT